MSLPGGSSVAECTVPTQGPLLDERSMLPSDWLIIHYPNGVIDNSYRHITKAGSDGAE
jgi:hypothetical protein